MNLEKINRIYTKKQWEKEFEFNKRGFVLSCPRCNLPGYMAHTAPATPMYSMCKLCGFWQAVGEEPRQCNLFHHICKGNKNPLPPTAHPRKGYCWYEGDKAECEFCDEIITNKVKWPAELDNPKSHPLLQP